MITKISITNFKAIQNWLELPLAPFSVFIGNNGSGKSSVMEALRTLHLALTKSIAEAFEIWGGLDKVRNYNAIQDEITVTQFGFKQKYQPVIIRIECLLENKKFEYQVSFNLSQNSDFYVIENEELRCDEKELFSTNVIDNVGNSFCQIYEAADGKKEFTHKSNTLLLSFQDGNPHILHKDVATFRQYVSDWQFLFLKAHDMGKPVMQNRLTKEIRLDYDGRNIAEYILWIRGQGQEYLDNLVRKMIFVLPYLKQIQPHIQETFNREVELLMHENNKNSEPLPGWLLSSGTLRILALLSMFETPRKPSVLFVDEIENGLDPRTVGMLIGLIENEYHSKQMQVVVTTHSPYFLDLVSLDSLIVTEKNEEGSNFHIPKDEESLNIWKEKFSPGKLYSMGKLTK